MSQLVYGIAGAAIGFYFGGPQGAAWGWTIGISVGGLLNPPEVQGPRLDDKRIQISQQGADIPESWASDRIAGNVIDSTDLIETANVDGGKGGPEVTSFAYSVTCAIAICEGIHKNVRRIWADAKLVYDARSDVDEAMRLASAEFRAFFTFYPGDEEQLPDPSLEAIHGAGNVPAYRGTCYIVFTGLPLGDYGNRIPSFSFELSDEDAIPSEEVPEDLTNLVLGPWQVGDDGMPRHSIPTNVVPSENFVNFDRTLTATGETFDTFEAALDALPETHRTFVGYATSVAEVLSNYGQPTGINDDFGPKYVWLAFNVEPPSVVHYTVNNDVCEVFHDVLGVLNPALDPGRVPAQRETYLISTFDRPVYPGGGMSGLVKFIADGEGPPLGYIDDGTYTCVPYEPTAFTLVASLEQWFDYVPGVFSTRESARDAYIAHANQYFAYKDFGIVGGNHLEVRYVYIPGDLLTGVSVAGMTVESHNYVNGALSNIAYQGRTIEAVTPVPRFIHSPHYWIRVQRMPTLPTNTCVPGAPDDNGGIAEMAGRPDFCVMSNGTVSRNARWELVTGTFRQLQAVAYDSTVALNYPQGPLLATGDANYSNATYWNAQAALAGVAGTYPTGFPDEVDKAARRVQYEIDLDDVPPSTITLAEIVTDVCVTAGLREDQIDVTELDDIVMGYTRTRRMSARATLEPLRRAYFFDAVESGDIIKFVKRGGAPVFALTLDDLAAAQDHGGDQPVESERGQETELPAQLSVAYKAYSADYQPGAQLSQRIINSTQQEAGVEVPVVMDDDKALQVADFLLYDAWVSRNRRNLSTWRKWAAIEPTDVGTVDDGETLYRIRIEDKTEDTGVITLKGCDDDASIVLPGATGGASPPPGSTSTTRFDGPTRYELLDIPIARDVDDDAGFYVAAGGLRASWRGGRLFRSIAGSDYEPYQNLERDGILGVADTALGTFTGGNVVDELNTVDVVLYGGSLATITRDQLLNAGNAAVLGDEVIQFLRAELVDPDTYRLSGLLRGRLGTEQHMGTHVAGDRFVLLSASLLYRPPFEISLLGDELQYKAITLGTALSSDTARGFTNTGAGLKPLSPVHLTVTPLANGSLSVAWVRRTRIGGAWRDGVDVPLGEASERYRVRILRADEVLEEQTVTTNSATVGVGGTFADMDDLVAEVCQLSDRVGPGFPATVIF